MNMPRRSERYRVSRLCLLSPALCLCAGLALADDGTTSDAQGSPAKLTLNDWFTPRYNGADNTQGNLVVLRAYIPWDLFDVPQLNRISIPITTSSPGKAVTGNGLIDDFPSGPTGLGDTEFYNVAQFKLHEIGLSLGPVFIVPTGTGSGVGGGKITAGPAWGLKLKSGQWTIGTFSLSYFSVGGHSGFASTAKTKLQPIIDLALSGGWEIGTSDMNFTYDWNRGHYTNIPFGLALGKNVELAARQFKLVQQVEYNFASTQHSSAWTLRFSLEIPLPELN
jgi:hypothetical protein